MIQRYFGELTDHRQAWKIKYNLLEIIVMTICAVIAGCNVWEDIADYCQAKIDFFREKLHMELTNGVPSHDTMQRVWGMIEPDEFERCFRNWVKSVCKPEEKEVISIDGKTNRGSKSKEKNAIHMVSAWANSQQMVLGQIAVDEKSNEITAVPELIKMLDLKGCIVTADAMSCQKSIVQEITNKEADYVLGLKGNQPEMCKNVREYFEATRNKAEGDEGIKVAKTVEIGHGRTEIREYYITSGIDWFDKRDEWSGLKAFGMVHSLTEENGKLREEERYYITSLDDVPLFSEAVRKHWGIENSLHWCLDVTFQEDHSRIRKDHSAENMAVVRHIVLNILRNYPEEISLARKRRRCAYDDTFFGDVIATIL